FVIRQYSPARTIGGGHVLEAGNRKHKRYKQDVCEQLAIKDKGTPGELVLAKLQEACQPLALAEVARLIGISETEVHNALESLGSEVKSCVLDGNAFWFTFSYFNRLGNEIRDILMEFHRKFPLRPGLPKEELKSRVFSSWNSKLFTAFLMALDSQGILTMGNSVFLADFQPEPQGKMATTAIQISKDYATAGLTPPDWQTVMEKYKLEKADAEELLQYFLRQGSLVKTPPNFYFAQGSLQAAKEQVLSLLSEKGEISPADVKDLLGTSRKFLIPILEYFDAQKITRRVGDKRIKF
ncbi:MAG TPA: SelB C-terminal domain-containing protein, partial [Verrucomicrobiae bacterium]|nr:SelB C-terminal domain-containing protein [Verrucomicrobiae bacterium]